jgi:hypothetical protein
MASENIYNSDRTRRSCPNGSSVGYPCGTIHHVKVGDRNCANCPCYGGFDSEIYSSKAPDAIICHYPKFSPMYGIHYNKVQVHV